MADNYGALEKLIQEKKARIGVIGLGYVGLPIVLRFCEEGLPVTGFDVDPEKIRLIKKGKSYIKHIPSEKIAQFALGRKPSLAVTTDMSGLAKMDAIIICVPTPLSDKREPDLTYVENTGIEIAKYLRKGQIVSLESTTYPGTTDELLLPMFEARGLKVRQGLLPRLLP